MIAENKIQSMNKFDQQIKFWTFSNINNLGKILKILFLDADTYLEIHLGVSQSLTHSVTTKFYTSFTQYISGIIENNFIGLR